MSHQARILRRLGKYKEAEEVLKQQMNLAQENGYGDGIANAHYEWAKLDRDRGKWESSRMHWKSSIDWCENHENEADLDVTVLLVAVGNLGWVEFHLGNRQEGKELIQRSLDSLEHIGGKGYLTTLRLRLAIVERSLGSREKALQHAQEAYFWAERLGMVRELEGARALLTELEQAQAAAGAGE